MSLLFTKKEAFDKTKKYLEDNQYLFEYRICGEQFFIKIVE